jgi:hypothetical protein
LSDIGTTRVSTRALLAYAVLALPLTMAALPVYVYVPKLYADERGLALATVGFLLRCRIHGWAGGATGRPRGRAAARRSSSPPWPVSASACSACSDHPNLRVARWWPGWPFA